MTSRETVDCSVQVPDLEVKVWVVGGEGKGGGGCGWKRRKGGRVNYGMERREEGLWVGYRKGRGGVMSNRQERMS